MRVQLLLLCLVCSMWAMDAQAQSGPCPGGAPLAFEGAEGYGRCAQGGRGGVVVDVTNLDDDQFNPPVGSLRHCLEVSTGPRICNVKTTGWVSLGGHDIIVRHPNVTLNCVGNGHALGMKDGGLYVRASHTIFRNCRVLPGLMSWTQSGMNANGIFLWSTESGGPTSNHIIDHSSIGYTSDDHIAASADLITIQDSILGPALECNDCGGKGLLVNGSSVRMSVIRSLQVHTYIGWPRMTAGKLDVINTIEYNSHGTPAQIMPIYGTTDVNFLSNAFLNGPNLYTHQHYQSIRTIGTQPYSGSIYVHDNIGRWWDGSQLHNESLATPDSSIIWGDNGGVPISSSFVGTGLSLVNTPMSASQVETSILATVGPFPRSAFEHRVIQDVQTRSGSWPPSVDAYGGWPVLTGGGGTTPPPGPTPPPSPPPSGPFTVPSSVEPGASFTIQHSVSNCQLTDWIGIYQPANSGEGYESWTYVATCPGSVQMTAPSSAGTYKVRYLPDNSYHVAAEVDLAVGTVVAPPSPAPTPPSPTPVVTDTFSNVTNGGKVLMFEYVSTDCPDGVSKATGPVKNGKRTVTMTCKP